MYVENKKNKKKRRKVNGYALLGQESKSENFGLCIKKNHRENKYYFIYLKIHLKYLKFNNQTKISIN